MYIVLYGYGILLYCIVFYMTVVYTLHAGYTPLQ